MTFWKLRFISCIEDFEAFTKSLMELLCFVLVSNHALSAFLLPLQTGSLKLMGRFIKFNSCKPGIELLEERSFSFNETTTYSYGNKISPWKLLIPK